jgi:nucleotide-binding universal stress UspA family protein
MLARLDSAMDKILVAIDGSKHSPRVVDFAVQLAESINGSLLLVNVTPDMPVPEGYSEYAKEEGVAPGGYSEEISRGVLENMADRVKGVKFETASAVGNPAELILSIAKSKRATMIVLGVFGLHHLSRIRSLGSVARRVVENSDLPVVLVP